MRRVSITEMMKQIYKIIQIVTVSKNAKATSEIWEPQRQGLNFTVLKTISKS
jgi:hypothetical protein